MMIPSKYIENAVDQMASLPGVGKRTALRLVLQLLNRSKEDIENFTNAFQQMKEHAERLMQLNKNNK